MDDGETAIFEPTEGYCVDQIKAIKPRLEGTDGLEVRLNTCPWFCKNLSLMEICENGEVAIAWKEVINLSFLQDRLILDYNVIYPFDLFQIILITSQNPSVHESSMSKYQEKVDIEPSRNIDASAKKNSETPGRNTKERIGIRRPWLNLEGDSEHGGVSFFGLVRRYSADLR